MLFTEEDKTFIKIVPDYGLWTTETYDKSPLTKNKKGLDWITLSRSYLKSGCSSAMHHSVITRTVSGPN